MSQKLVQVVALVTYGNLFLQGRSNEFDFEKLVTENCYGRDFIDPPIDKIAGSTKVIASDTNNWFKYLKDMGAKQLKLFYKKSSHIDLPDHITTAFVGGGSQWLIEVQFDNSSDLYLSEWYPSTEIGLNTSKAHCVRFNHDIAHLDDVSESVQKAREKLSKSLQDLADFARKFDYARNWVNNFNNALMTLQEFEPSMSDEFLPLGMYSKEARQLIEAAFASWVFGGMGSWNDMNFGETNHAKYESLSESLYTTLCEAIVAAVNSYP
ncbi:MAG: hypothetical protein E4H14_04795 [Candidatus Thorarchaeota archaeon]|nr:MAG: hypothetical protein E4H14_04795 [Candidatus Thorarchaeota archaeon]